MDPIFRNGRFSKELFIFLLVFTSVLTRLPKSCPGDRIGNITKLKAIRDCDVIEGDLIIRHIMESESSWHVNGNLKIREITGFLILYNLGNLRSMDILFPVLSVIRGQNLFDQEYALLIYLMPDLEDIHLPRLNSILRGSVFIQENIVLSYLSTINFEQIAHSNTTSHLIQDDRARSCNKKCTFQHCWNFNDCQNMCSNCLVGYSGAETKNETCHGACVGGCYEPHKSTSCVACAHFRYNEECMDSCSGNTFEWDGYKCVSDMECKFQRRYIYGGKCVSQCPRNYPAIQLKSEKAIPKCSATYVAISCNGGMVSSLQTSFKYRGCKVVNGSLSISLSERAMDNIHEIIENLEQIEKVTGYVNIFHSLVKSLNILQNLAVIGGNELWDSRYSFVVHNCKNLMNLWKPSNHLVLKEGEVRFYQNPMLCPEKVKELLGNKTYSKKFLPYQDNIRYMLNGYKKSCRVRKLEITSEALFQKGVVALYVRKPTDIGTLHNLAGYHVYYKEIEGNFKFKSTQEVDNSWELRFAAYSNEAGPTLEILIDKLKPATKYAFLVKTETIPSEVTYQSEIFYTETKRYYPSWPIDMKIKQDGSLATITFSPPTLPHGENVFYYLTVTKKPPSLPDASKQYCSLESFPSAADKTKKTKVMNHPPNVQNDDTAMFASTAPKDGKSKIRRDQVEINLTKFIYYGQTPAWRRRFKRKVGRTIGSKDSKEDMLQLQKMLIATGLQTQNSRKQYGFLSQMKSPFSAELNVPMNVDTFENVNLLLKQVDERIAGHQSARDYSKLSPFNCSVVPKSGKTLGHPKFEMELVTNYRYTVEIRACHNVSAEVSKSTSGTVDNVPDCWLCSAPLKKDFCLIHPDDNIQVQDISLHMINGSAALVEWAPPGRPIKPEEVFSYTIHLSIHSYGNTYTAIEDYCVNSTDRKKVINVTRPGGYKVQVSANLHCDYGNRTLSKEEYIHISILNSYWWIILPVAIPSFLLLLLICPIVRSINKIHSIKSLQWFKNSVYGYRKPIWVNYFYGDDNPPQFQHLGTSLIDVRLGGGNFGNVYRGKLYAKDIEQEVAAKQLWDIEKSTVELHDMLIKEGAIMRQLRSYYLVQAHGIVSSRYGLFLVMELMSNGTLYDFLTDRRKGVYFDQPEIASEKHLLRISIQIADGMNYLQSKHIIHRDLAASNCLLDDNFNAKISDFGLARLVNNGIYKTSSSQTVRIRRMPPEYYNDNKYTHKSDVWTFGITLYELCTDAAVKPYYNKSDVDVQITISKGVSLEEYLPASTPTYFRTIMNQCWKQNPSERLDFQTIFIVLLAEAKKFNMLKEFKKKSFSYHAENTELPRCSDTSSGTVYVTCKEPELDVETPLTVDSYLFSNGKENEDHKELSHLTWTEKAWARIKLFKQTILRAKIFPYSLGDMQDGEIPEKNQNKRLP